MKPKSPAKEIQTFPACRLHAALESYLGYCFYKAASHIRARVDHSLAPLGVVAPQYGMMIILQVHGSKTQGELCESMGIDKATMVRMLDGLEKKGYVTRVQSKEDRRANRLELTKRGKQAIEKMEMLRKKAEDEFLAPLNKSERTQLTATIAKLIRSHESD